MIWFFKFRRNDLNPSLGKQIEFTNPDRIHNFFEIVGSTKIVTFVYRSLQNNDSLDGTRIKVKLTLSPARGDYKIYSNDDGSPSLKEFLLNSLHLSSQNNSEDYFALLKVTPIEYSFFYIPKATSFASIYSRIRIKDDFVSFQSLKDDQPEASKEWLKKYLAAIRTKPFLLLAGISGTGKSQIVKEMAFSTCPDLDGLRQSEVSPGNYCLVEVKPNWHDSSELLGYDSVIKGHYVVTKFVKFVAKAMRYPEVPFFVCLDEMNLAPVEQYFAEFLSVLESRKLVNDKIISEPLIEKECFQKDIVACDLFNLTLPNTGDMQIKSASLSDADLNGCAEIWQKLKTEGLCIPQNLIVIGTVNMDESTHQFSRKVIDRVMTFEMNEADFNAYFVDNVTLSYVADPLSPNLFLASHVSGNKAIEKIENLDAEFKKKVATMLDALNKALNDTPFKIAYRVQNELVLYFTELLRDNPDADQEQILWTALDDIMMMKVLPRIEGDDELLGNRSDGALAKLMEFASDNNLEHSIDKIDEMLKRLERSHFTSFWP